jgi:periplasmic mercuric ion binding protein
MKKLILIIVLNVFSISLVYAATTEYQLGVDGVGCPFCVYGIEKQLNKLEGIERIETDIEKSLVLLIMKDGFVLDESSVNEAVTKAGFSLRSFALSDKAEQ